MNVCKATHCQSNTSVLTYCRATLVSSNGGTYSTNVILFSMFSSLLSSDKTDPNKSLVINVEYNLLDPLLGHRVIAW
jgi:hypothetical protein